MVKNYGILAFCAFSLCGAVASDADAAPSTQTTMLCEVTYNPQADTHGNFGYVRAEMLSGSNCGNTQWFFCSTGATHKYCHPDYTYSEQALLNLHARLVDVAQDGLSVKIYSDTTGEGGNRKGMYATFID